MRAALVGPNGSRSFAELDANANRLARALRNRGLVAGDAVALIAEQPTDLRRDRVRVPASGVPADADQLAPHRRRSELHRRRLRGQGAGHRRSSWRPWPVRAWPAAPACKVALVAGGADRRLRVASRRRWPPKAPRRSPDPAPGSTMLYTSGTTGRPKGVHRPRGRGGGRDREPLRLRRGRWLGPPVHRAAVPRRAAGVLAEHAPRVRRDRRADGPVGRRGRAASHRRPQGHPHAHGADHVPSAAVAARRRPRRLRHDEPTPRAARRRAVPGPGEARHHRVARSDRRRVLRRDRGRRQLRRLGDLARPSRHRRPALHRGPGHRRRRGRAQPARRRDRPRVPAGAGGDAVRLLQGRREDRRGVPRASTSPSATSGTSTTRATSTSPTGAPT